MEVVNFQMQPQGSICSDSNAEELPGSFLASLPLSRRLCFVGTLASNQRLQSLATCFNVPILASPNGLEYAQDSTTATVFVLQSFEGEVFNTLYKSRQPLLGPVAVEQLAAKKCDLPDNTRPLFNLAMMGIVICFTGFRNKNDLTSLIPLIHHMGGSIRKNMSEKVTHLIANVCGGEKYQYATLFKVPVMHSQWVYASWEKRHEVEFSASSDVFVAGHKLKPFHGAKLCFAGFSEEEEKHMTEILLANGGSLSTLKDCTHVVTDRPEAYIFEASSAPHSDCNFSNAATVPFVACTNYDSFLETVHERSTDYDNKNDIDRVCLDLRINLNTSNTPKTPCGRKRKNTSLLEHVSSQIKKRRDKCVSERKGKSSGFFKAPLNYLSNRRRTIDSSTLNQSLNQSVVSSSGIFNVDAVNDLSSFVDGQQCAPQVYNNFLKGSIFTRPLNASKFGRNCSSKGNKLDLNMTTSGFGDCRDGIFDIENLCASCIPSISFNHMPCDFCSECRKDNHGPSLGVVDRSISERPEAPSKAHIVRAEWFWTSVQKVVCLDEKEYFYDEHIQQTLSPGSRRNSHQATTPGSATRRKRKRIHETLLSLTHQQSPALHKRRSSVSDAGLLSVSGSFLDCTGSPEKALVDGVESGIDTPRKVPTPRHQVFLELIQTESNYVDIIHTIINTFKHHLENMLEEEALLNNTELNLIFGKIPPIYETHVKMLQELKSSAAMWSENMCIGSIIVKYSQELRKAYPPFINYFEEMKEVLVQCDQNKPRFHAFLKACQTRPECGRQSLQELMIRPVQRLGSMCLLLASILKNTPKSNPDHTALEHALRSLKDVMDLINEDKKKTEAQVTLFNIFNDIDNCPPDIVSSHRSFIAKAEVTQVSTEGLSSKGNTLMLFLFSDQVEVCKKKSKAFNNLKSPVATVGSMQRPIIKPYKHVRLLPLNTIKRVVDIKETEDCQKVFCFVCRSNEDVKERVYSFAIADEGVDKMAFIRTLTRQMANNACTADADKFLACLESQQLDIDTTDVSNGTLSKAFKFATRTRLKVGRAFSFNKTPSKLKRAVSSMMSPFGSSTNITPSSELAQMRLASYNNINELGSSRNCTESPPLPPMSVQPTRKNIASSFERL